MCRDPTTMEDRMGEKRKMRSLASRRRWARRWLDSQTSQHDFAALHGLSEGSLSRWVRDFRRSHRVAEEPGRFVEVTAEPPATAAMAVRIVVGSVTLEFGQLPPAEYVAALGRISC